MVAAWFSTGLVNKSSPSSLAEMEIGDDATQPAEHMSIRTGWLGSLEKKSDHNFRRLWAARFLTHRVRTFRRTPRMWISRAFLHEVRLRDIRALPTRVGIASNVETTAGLGRGTVRRSGRAAPRTRDDIQPSSARRNGTCSWRCQAPSLAHPRPGDRRQVE